MSRLKLISVVGNGDLEPDDPRAVLAESIGRALVDAGYGILTGGLGGVMECASRGARSSPAHRTGMIVAAILRIIFAVVATKLLAVPGLLLVGAMLLFWVCWEKIQIMYLITLKRPCPMRMNIILNPDVYCVRYCRMPVSY